MERLNKADQACAVASAAGHELNDDLTVILSSVTATIDRLEPGHPARPLLLELRGAAQRCAWKASGLLSFGARGGTQAVRAPFDSLIEN